MIHRKVLFKYEYFYQFYEDMELLVNNVKTYYQSDTKRRDAVDVLWNGFIEILTKKGYINDIVKYQEDSLRAKLEPAPRVTPDIQKDENSNCSPGQSNSDNAQCSTDKTVLREKKRVKHRKSLQLSNTSRLIPHYEPEEYKELPISESPNSTEKKCDFITATKEHWNLPEPVLRLHRVDWRDQLEKIQGQPKIVLENVDEEMVEINQIEESNNITRQDTRILSSYGLRRKTMHCVKAVKQIKPAKIKSKRELRLMSKELFQSYNFSKLFNYYYFLNFKMKHVLVPTHS